MRLYYYQKNADKVSRGPVKEEYSVIIQGYCRLFLHKTIYCWYLLEAPCLGEALLMSTHNSFFFIEK